MKGFVLASASPRRAELMRRVGLGDCAVIPAEIDEEGEPLTPRSASALSLRKAKDVAGRCRDRELFVIAADTLVVYGGGVLGKPKDEGEAFSMLRTLSGQKHTVVTGVTVVRGDAALTREEETAVWIRPLSDDQIRRYIATGEPMDKAGAYGIQEKGALLAERIEGDFYNVMGLPLMLLSRMLAEFGFYLL